MDCEFCKQKLSSLSNLNYHKKTNKKCLQVQNNNDVSAFIPCEFCNKTFTSQIMKKHLISCKNKKETVMQEKDDIILEKDKELKEKDLEIIKLNTRITELETENNIYRKDHELIKTIAIQPKNVTNNKIKVVNTFFDNPERVKQMVSEKLTKNHIVDGQKGIAKFAYDNILKDDDGDINYFCTDPSRCVFKFQNNDGYIEKDIKANKLTNLLLDSGIKHKVGVVAPTLWTKEDGSIDVAKFQVFNPSANEIIMIKSDNSVFRNELACLTST
jgi:hypothetical protein